MTNMARRITISIHDDGVWQRLQQLLHSQELNAHNVLWELTGVTTADETNTALVHGVFLLTVPQQVLMVTASDEEDDSSASDKEDNSGASDNDSSFTEGEEKEDSDEDEDE
uniref:Uncharacterized protein n=1 Tax=Chromera velia CCMP2878 TaxID=1169474 RepID=A0A0G4GNI9_9ALVE|eukprot:Cvel_22692.t1-p1 / transcript=Cvel_22692.t1 / gene=Cvel_22692 / organism=Chromera_velia_CCMP2878 / gene_product=hypothetical protein / transcript_product=hypothetical protein / location=Cvel_scaffold2259:13611-13940(+) / protein_length=110 / sequence_SO=supercontig / SO=protein_coding / is_pseudo=false